MVEPQGRGLLVRIGREKWVRDGQQRLLQFHRHPEVCFHLVVFSLDLAILLFKVANIGQQQFVLDLEKRLRGNKAKESGLLID